MKIKIASTQDLEFLYDEKIKNHPEDVFLPIQREKRIKSIEDGTRLFFIGFVGEECICELAASVSNLDTFTQNKDKVLGNGCAYLFSFFTKEEYRGRGYFSKLYRFAENTLKEMGFEYLTLGVEPDDSENIERYRKWGYTELIYRGTEEFDGMKIDVLYYRKKLD